MEQPAAVRAASLILRTPLWKLRSSRSCGLGSVTEFFRTLLCSGIKKDPHPVFQCKKLPDLHGPILGATPVFVHETPNRLRAEQSALFDIGLREKIVHHLSQI